MSSTSPPGSLAEQIWIPAEPAVVWEIYSDVTRWPRWTASVSSVNLEPAGSLALGSVARIRQPRLPPARWKVTDLQPQRSWTWESRVPGATTTAGHRLTPADGGTDVELWILQRGVLGRPAGWLYRRLTRRYLRMEAEGLRAASTDTTSRG